MDNGQWTMDNERGEMRNYERTHQIARTKDQFPSKNIGAWDLVIGHSPRLAVYQVSKQGGTLFRWWRYARMLRKIGRDADVVIAFSSVSAGVPLWMSRLKKPKKILRLGGDFLWERYTDGGGGWGFYEGREWYDGKHAPMTNDQFRRTYFRQFLMWPIATLF
jgi:hypothetical protein